MIKKVLFVVSLLAICFSIVNFDKPTYYQDDSISDSGAYQTKEITNEVDESEVPTTQEETSPEDNDTKKYEKNVTYTPAKAYTENDLYVLSHVIFAEAGNYSEELQIGVGSVVLNRVADERFPDSIEEVVFQDGQYACTWDGNYYKEPSEEAIAIATYLLENGSQYPEYVIFQAEFTQGDKVYKQVGNTYFCYYEKDVSLDV